MLFFRRRLIRAVITFVSWPKTTLAIALALLIASAGLALAKLHISTDQNQLFSSNAPFFHNYLEFDRQFPENDALFVTIEPNPGVKYSPQRWMQAADRITARLRQMKGQVKDAACRVPLEKLGTQALLYENSDTLPQTFNQVLQLAQLAQIWNGKPSALTAFLGPNPMSRFLAAMILAAPPAPSSAPSSSIPPSSRPSSAPAAAKGQNAAPLIALIADSWNQTLAEPRSDGDHAIIADPARLGGDSPLRLGYYEQPDQTDLSRRLLLVQVAPIVNYTSLTSISDVVEKIRHAVGEIASDFPEFSIGVTGRPALAADEMRTTDQDSHHAEIIAIIVIFIGMSLVLRSLWMALAAEIALGVAIGWTFGWATIAVGRLNLLSVVFLIALIGIGMDYLVQILMAYRREAKRRLRPKAIWTRVFRSVAPPINTACLGAAGAFLASLATDFRGAAELGVIAGGGLLLCLIAGYTVLPALLTLFPPAIKQLDAAARYTGHPAHARGWRKLLPILWELGLLAGVPFMLKFGFNPNLLDLQARNLRSVQLVGKLQTWSAVVLSKNLAQLEKARVAVKASPYVLDTDSILRAYRNQAWIEAHQSEVQKIDWTEPPPLTPAELPPLAGQARTLAERYRAAADALSQFADVVERISASSPQTAPATAQSIAQTQASLTSNLIPRAAMPATAHSPPASASTTPALAAARLSHWQRGFLAELRGAVETLSPKPPDPAALPQEMRRHWLSDDGVYALYITPRKNLWKREDLAEFEKDIEARVHEAEAPLTVTGITSDIYHSTSSIERSFYRTTLLSLALIFVLVLVDLRSISQTFLAVSVLAFGLPMLVALMGLFKVQWNFANFFGLPILIGAGHEYGVFLVHRYREALRDPRRAWKKWDSSDRALALCAFITTSSFGFFWALGHHKGLRSLGLVMSVGTACIYCAALLVLRPLLLRRLARRSNQP